MPDSPRGESDSCEGETQEHNAARFRNGNRSREGVLEVTDLPVICCVLRSNADGDDHAIIRRNFMTTRNWFITDTSSGFGRALTENLLARGDRVAATVRKVSALEDLKARYGEQLWVAALDVTDTDSVRSVVDQAFAETGRIDVIVNNAGYGLFGAAEEVSDDQIRHQIDTNVIGSIQVIRAALPHLRAQGGGRILQVSSEWADRLSEFQSVSHEQMGDRRLRRVGRPGSRAVRHRVHDRRTGPHENGFPRWPRQSAGYGRL